MSRAWTGYPKIASFPHFAPTLGALPIPTIQRDGPPRAGAYPGPPPWASQPYQGLGAVPDVIVQQAAGDQSGPAVIPDRIFNSNDPAAHAPETLPEVGLGIATAAISGAVTGGVAAASWRGAGIGAGINAGLWSGFTAFNAWPELGPRTKLVLGGATAAGLGAALALFLTRTRRS